MNVLSYQLGTIFSGKEINTFLNERHSHCKEADRLARNYNFGFKPECNYMLVRQEFRTNDKPRLGFIKVKERNGFYA